jgi:hypothetical protein
VFPTVVRDSVQLFQRYHPNIERIPERAAFSPGQGTSGEVLADRRIDVIRRRICSLFKRPPISKDCDSTGNPARE